MWVPVCLLGLVLLVLGRTPAVGPVGSGAAFTSTAGVAGNTFTTAVLEAPSNLAVATADGTATPSLLRRARMWFALTLLAVPSSQGRGGSGSLASFCQATEKVSARAGVELAGGSGRSTSRGRRPDGERGVLGGGSPLDGWCVPARRLTACQGRPGSRCEVADAGAGDVVGARPLDHAADPDDQHPRPDRRHRPAAGS